jgi:hypothetical protein
MSPHIAQGYLVGNRPGVHNPTKSPIGVNLNIERIQATITTLSACGSVHLSNSRVLPPIDTIILCTGYAYSFPFLSEIQYLEVTPYSVAPLY